MRTKLKIDSEDLFRRRLEEKDSMNEDHARKCREAAEAGYNRSQADKTAQKIKIGKPAFAPKF